MKLKNKKTGEIGLIHCDATIFSNKIGVFIDNNNHIDFQNPYKIYDSLAQINDEWEDYEDPKDSCSWYVDWDGEVVRDDNDAYGDQLEIGNVFEAEEKAEKAVEKLKAFKRLKDKGFRFIGKTYETDKRFGSIFYKVDEDTYSEDIIEDLDLLFEGKE